MNRCMFTVITILFLSASTVLAGPQSSPGPSVQLTQAEIADMQASVKRRLKDPDSAQFGEMRAFESADGQIIDVCGTVNAKNSFGGYVGDAPFYGTVMRLHKDDGTPVSLSTVAYLGGASQGGWVGFKAGFKVCD